MSIFHYILQVSLSTPMVNGVYITSVSAWNAHCKLNGEFVCFTIAVFINRFFSFRKIFIKCGTFKFGLVNQYLKGSLCQILEMFWKNLYVYCVFKCYV